MIGKRLQYEGALNINLMYKVEKHPSSGDVQLSS